MVIRIAFDRKLKERVVVQTGKCKGILFVLPLRFVNGDIGGLAGNKMIASGFLHPELLDIVRHLFDFE